MANKVKGFLHRIGRFLAAPFMGYVWMARYKTLVKDCNRLIESNNNYGQRFTELRATSARTISQLQSKYDKREAVLDALHGYALDLDAQCSDAMQAFDRLNRFCVERRTATQTAIYDVKGIIDSLPCASRISRKDFQRLNDAFNAIPTEFKPQTIRPMVPVFFDPRPHDAIAQV